MKLIKQFWLLAGFLIASNIIVFLSIGEGAFLTIYSDLMPVLCSLIGVFGIFMAYNSFKTSDYIKTAWLLLLIGVVFDFIAEGLYAFFEVVMTMDMNEVYPSLADLFWILAYPLSFAGLVLLLVGYRKSGFPLGSIKMHSIWIILFCVLAIGMVYFILVPIVQDPETDFLGKAASVFYPVGDILIVTLAMILFFLIRQFGAGHVTMPWLMLALGFFFFTASDLSFALLQWQSSYEAGSFTDIGWNLGYLVLGMAGLYQSNLIRSVQENLA